MARRHEINWSLEICYCGVVLYNKGNNLFGFEGLSPESGEDAVGPVVGRDVESTKHLRRCDGLRVHSELLVRLTAVRHRLGQKRIIVSDSDYLCLSLPISLCLPVSDSLYVSLALCLYLYLYLCLNWLLSLTWSVSVCLWLCLPTFLSLCTVCMYVCVGVFISLLTSLCLCLSVAVSL